MRGSIGSGTDIRGSDRPLRSTGHTVMLSYNSKGNGHGSARQVFVAYFGSRPWRTAVFASGTMIYGQFWPDQKLNKALRHLTVTGVADMHDTPQAC